MQFRQLRIDMATYIEVQQQIQALQKEAAALKAAERKGVIERMREAIAVYDITAADLGLAAGARQSKGGSAKRSPRTSKQAAASATAAYSDDKGNTWGGRGPRPRWLKEALAGGAKIEDFAR
jgi:DNA-binding protein H-NS